MGKIEKLTRDIEKLEYKIEILDQEVEEGREHLTDKMITKAEYNFLKQRHQTKIRDLRTAIGRKEKARVLQEDRLKEKLERKRKKE